jgi:holo-[acyl-carrier protein] synthase
MSEHLLGPARAYRRAAALDRTMRPMMGARCAAVGVDAVHIATWASLLDKAGFALAQRVYTDDELAFADGRPERLSTRLAAKEAVLKALGTGVRGAALRDVEVVSAPDGAPTIRLHAAAEQRRRALGLGPVSISLCHEDQVAYAVAMALPADEAVGDDR